MAQIQKISACWFLGATLAAIGLGASSPPTERTVSNDEFGINVAFSVSDAVCTASTGGHAHGFVAAIGLPSINCGSLSKQPNLRTISVTAQYNAGFSARPDDFLRSACDAAKEPAIFREKERLGQLSIAGRASAACGRTETDGTLAVYVVTQAGEWPGKDEETDPTFKTPLVNYICVLITVPARLDEDLARFKSVLSTIHITR